MHYAEGSAMTPILVKLITTGIKNAPVPFFIKPIGATVAGMVDKTFTNGELRAHFGWVEESLSTGTYFVGETFSAADIQMSYPVQASFARQDLLPNRPYTRAWLDRVEARPAFKKAFELGGEPIMTTMPK